MSLTKSQQIAALFPGAKSVCRCGHSGDARDGSSQHGARNGLNVGHGACSVEGCLCDQFTWNGNTPEFDAAIGGLQA